MFRRVATVLSALLVLSVLKTAAADSTCSGARSLSLCAQTLTPFSQNSATWQSECGVTAPAPGVEMLMAQGLQFNTGSCPDGTTATCCTSCLACGTAGVDCTGAPTAPVTTSSGLPAGWSIAIPCAVDNADRVLSDVTVTYLPTTTPETCAASCAAKGFTFAGVEYSDECYCGTGFLDGVTPPSADVGDCNMTCAGDAKQLCGGSWRIQLYSSQ